MFRFGAAGIGFGGDTAGSGFRMDDGLRFSHPDPADLDLLHSRDVASVGAEGRLLGYCLNSV